jgi:hypothetical protein
MLAIVGGEIVTCRDNTVSHCLAHPTQTDETNLHDCSNLMSLEL